MKHHLLTLSLILACLACAPQATAQDAPSDKPDSAAAPAEGNAVGEALKEIKKLGSSPEAKKVPGFKPAPGKVIKEGHGHIVADWKSYITL